MKGDSCLFSHDLKSVPCRFFYLYHKCLQGESCKYAHDMAQADAEAYFEQERKEEEERNRKLAEENEASSSVPEIDMQAELPFGITLATPDQVVYETFGDGDDRSSNSSDMEDSNGEEGSSYEYDSDETSESDAEDQKDTTRTEFIGQGVTSTQEVAALPIYAP